jgi:hypothetical protein
MTNNLFLLQKDTPAQIAMMRQLGGSLLAEFQKGKIIDQTLLPSNDGCPRMLNEYEAGEGIQKEHAAGGFLKLMRTTAQFAQIDARGKPFDPNDAANMKLFVEVSSR